MKPCDNSCFYLGWQYVVSSLKSMVTPKGCKNAPPTNVIGCNMGDHCLSPYCIRVHWFGRINLDHNLLLGWPLGHFWVTKLCQKLVWAWVEINISQSKIINNNFSQQQWIGKTISDNNIIPYFWVLGFMLCALIWLGYLHHKNVSKVQQHLGTLWTR